MSFVHPCYNLLPSTHKSSDDWNNIKIRFLTRTCSAACMVKGGEVSCFMFWWEMGEPNCGWCFWMGGGKDRGRGDCRRADSRRTMLPSNVIVFGYCIRSCSSLVSLRGVVTNHRTCIKAFYILHYIFFALAHVWRPEFAPTSSPSAQHSTQKGHPTLFSKDVFCRVQQDTA